MPEKMHLQGDLKRDGDITESTHKTSSNNRVFHDPIHGSIQMEPLLVAFIDTPQFQRLRDIKQLGSSYWVFPGAVHNRFEHSIGTAYLCGVMLTTLRDLHADDADVEITETEILCVKIAGLCHDLGHGPFSHWFEYFMKRVKPERSWRHEDMSCVMFDYLIQSNPQVQELMQRNGIEAGEIDFIKRLIQGRDPSKQSIPETTMMGGEKLQKWFLYEIVSNKRSGIDCDKFDYFARDAYQVGLSNSFNFNRFFQNIRIVNVAGQLQICVRDKEAFNLYEIFHVRWRLHHRVYQHKTTKSMEEMILDVFLLVNHKLRISDSVNDVRRFTHMTDSVIYDILRSTDQDEGIKKAQEILERLQRRQMYSFCGQVRKRERKQKKESKEGFLDEDLIRQEISTMDEKITADDFFVNVTYIGVGKGENPIDKVTFFTKSGKVVKMPRNFVSDVLPDKFEEEYIRVYSKSADKHTVVEKAFWKWCKEKGMNSQENEEHEMDSGKVEPSDIGQMILIES